METDFWSDLSDKLENILRDTENTELTAEEEDVVERIFFSLRENPEFFQQKHE